MKAAANVRRNRPAAIAASRAPTPPPPQFDFNFQMLETEGFLTPGEGRSQLAQEFRRIIEPLLRSSKAK